MRDAPGGPAKKKRKPKPRPAPKPKAAPQAQYYVSQGRAVEHAANQQRAAKVRRTRAYVKRATAPRPANAPNFPTYVPSRPGQTPRKQRPLSMLDTLPTKKGGRPRAYGNKQNKRYLQRREAAAIADLLTPQRTHLKGFESSISTLKDLGTVPGTGRFERLVREYRAGQAKRASKSTDILFSSDPAALHAAGFKQASTLDKILGTPGGVIGSAAAVASGLYHDPVSVPLKTTRQAVAAIPASVGGLIELGLHPIKTSEEFAKSYLNRVNEPYSQKVKRIRKEGAFADAADVAMAVAPAAGSLRGALLRGAPERAALRVSGGLLRHRPAHSQSVLRYYGGRALDKRRARKLEERLSAAEQGGPGLSIQELQAGLANRAAGRVVELPSRGHALKNRLRREVARDRGRGTYQFKHDQAERLNRVEKTINQLDKHEKRAFYYAAAFGIRSAEQAREILPQIRDRAIRERERQGLRVTGGLKRSDMLPDIQAILAEPGRAFTPRLAHTVESLREESLRAGREDPALTTMRRQSRRLAPVADVLGLRRGELPSSTEWRYTPGPEDFARAQAARKRTQPDVVEGSVVGEKPPVTQKALPMPKSEHPGAALERMRVAAALGKPLPGPKPRTGKGYWEQVAVGPRYTKESQAAYIKRVRETLKGKGLAEPLYYRSERYVGPTDFGSRALGGRRAMRSDFTYRGGNLAVGLQDTSTQQFVTGLARNIKRKHNWDMVASMVDKHRFHELAPPGGMKLRRLREEVYKRGGDVSKMAFWNPGVFRERAKQAMAQAEATHKPGAELERSAANRAADLSGEELGQMAAADALKQATVIGHGYVDEKLLETSGWQAIPIEVYQELEKQTTPSGVVGRSLDVAKGKMSRALLLSGNLPWAGFQVVSNAGMSAIASGGRSLNPANWVGAARWWHAMPKEQRREVGSILGLDTHGYDHSQVKLGATTNSSMVNAYRAFKAHPMFHTGLARGRGPAIRDLNPMEAMAQFDRKQNNVFRLLTAYSKAKPGALQKMMEDSGRLERAQRRAMGVLALPPNEAVNALLRDKSALEQLGEATRDWLGDYTSMTAWERHHLNRVVMFYPYLRYSLRLAFYTLPVKHPVMTAIAAQLGTLRADELRKLLGSDRIYWDVGKVYFGSGNKVKAIDLRRANPALNALWDAAGMENPTQLVGVLAPYQQWLVDQAFSQSTFRGSPWRVKGRAAPYNPGFSDYDAETRARIFAQQALSIFFPYRTADRLTSQGTQGDDSLLWSRRPIKFKGRTKLAKAQAAASKQHATFEQQNRGLVNELMPLIPRRTDDLTQAPLRKRIEYLKSQIGKKKKRKGGPTYFTGGSRRSSSSGGYYVP